MIKNFLRDETGLELSEYAVAAALIALAVVGIFGTLGNNINGCYRKPRQQDQVGTQNCEREERVKPQAGRRAFFSTIGELMIRKFLKDETGLELSEYAVAAALIALAVVGVFGTLGNSINGVIGNLANKIK